MYPKFFKQTALQLPVIREIILERDHLRSTRDFSFKQKSELENRLEALAQENDGLRKNVELLAKAEEQLQFFLAGKDSNENEGYCHCCRQVTSFKISASWLRDHYHCVSCSSIPRQRHLQMVLDCHFPDWEDKAIHESSSSNDFISRYVPQYSTSQFFSEVNPGEYLHGVRCENLEKLTFKNESFDIFITQDVFEHIFDPSAAAREIMRVLKPGGIHIFTAPKHKGLARSYPRARMESGEIQFLREASYHGNPIGDGRALVTWDYGSDFEKLISKWSDCNTTTYLTKDRSIGLDGEFLEVFVTHKK